MLTTGISFLSRNMLAGVSSQQQLDEHFKSTPHLVPQIRKISVAGHPMRYIVGGNTSGPTLLFIHGAPGSFDAYLDFFKDTSLTNKARLIAVDRAGYGGSGFGIPLPSLEDQSQLIKAVADHEEIDQMIIAGHSLGGPIAVKMAIDYPELISSMLLMAPSIDPDLEEWKWYQAFAISRIGRVLTPKAMVVAAEEIYYLKEQLQDMMKDYTGIKAYTILMQGEKDRLVNMGNAFFAERMIPDSLYQIQMLPKEDHFIPWTQKELVVKNLITLIDLEESKKI